MFTQLSHQTSSQDKVVSISFPLLYFAERVCNYMYIYFLLEIKQNRVNWIITHHVSENIQRAELTEDPGHFRSLSSAKQPVPAVSQEILQNRQYAETTGSLIVVHYLNRNTCNIGKWPILTRLMWGLFWKVAKSLSVIETKTLARTPRDVPIPCNKHAGPHLKAYFKAHKRNKHLWLHSQCHFK